LIADGVRAPVQPRGEWAKSKPLEWQCVALEARVHAPAARRRMV